MANHLVIYSVERIEDRQTVLSGLFKLFNATYACDVSKSNGVEKGWDDLNNGRGFGEQVTPNLAIASESNWISYSGRHNIKQIMAIPWMDNECLSFNFDEYTLVDRIASALSEDIPNDIRNDFDPSGIEIVVGPHDLYDDDKEIPKYIARAEFSIDFWDYGDSYHRREYLDLAVKNNQFMIFRTSLESVVGTTNTCIYRTVR